MKTTHVSGQAAATALFTLPADLLYLNCAAHGPPLRAVRDAASAALQDSSGSWLGTHWREQVERARAAAAGLFENDVEAIAFVPSAAYGLSVAARNMPLRPGQAVLVLEDQFPSNVLPWQQRCSEVGARLVVARCGDGQDWTDAILLALEADSDIQVLALPQVHWRDGAMLDLDRIATMAQARQAHLVLDLSQSLGVLPVRLDVWKPDFIVAVGYKWLLGGYGLAWLWAAPQWRESGHALEQGWMAYDQAALWQPGHTAKVEALPGARRYDAGGVCDAIRLSMAEAGLAQVQAWGVPTIAAQLQLRTQALALALDQRGIGGLRRPGHAPHICGLRPPAQRLHAVATALQNAGIVVTVGPECLRVAPHLHVGIGEMARVAETISSVL